MAEVQNQPVIRKGAYGAKPWRLAVYKEIMNAWLVTLADEFPTRSGSSETYSFDDYEKADSFVRAEAQQASEIAAAKSDDLDSV